MPVRVMSLNLRYDKPDPGEFAWIHRRDAVAALVSHYRPDILGTQEGKAHQLLDLHRLLPEYQSVGRDRTDTSRDEYCAVFYRVQRLSCQQSGDFALSDTPDILGSISPHWENLLPRMATWAIFTATDTAATLAVCNTHLDYPSQRARELGAELIRDRLVSILPAHAYLLLTGDFNCEPAALPRQRFLQPFPNQVQLQDALAHLPLEQQLTYNDFTDKGLVAIDSIYYDQRLRWQQAWVDRQRWQQRLPSDHWAVIADFAVPGADSL